MSTIFFFIQTLVKDARRPQKRVLRMVIRLFKIMICFNRCCTWEKDQKLIFGSSISVLKKKCLYCLYKSRLIYLIILLKGIRNMILVNSKTTCAVLIKRRFGQYMKLIHIIFSIQNIFTIVLLPNSD